MTVKNAMIIGGLNIDRNRITSVKLAPALPMISAMIAPKDIPFSASAALSGITASARIYNGNAYNGRDGNG